MARQESGWVDVPIVAVEEDDSELLETANSAASGEQLVAAGPQLTAAGPAGQPSAAAGPAGQPPAAAGPEQPPAEAAGAVIYTGELSSLPPLGLW